MFSLYFLPAHASTARKRRLGAVATAAGAALLTSYGIFTGDLEHLNTLGLVFMYVVMTQAWNILGGYGGYFNFGIVTFFGVGAYTSALLFHFFGLSPFLTAPLAGLASALLAFLIGIPALRLRGAYFAVVTMIVTFAMQILALDLPRTKTPPKSSACARHRSNGLAMRSPASPPGLSAAFSRCAFSILSRLQRSRSISLSTWC
jgi:ABC-type branched-subunit amino acid transport system permease subunit